MRDAVKDLAGDLFYRLQRLYDATIVTSRTMENHLRAKGVGRLERVPLGADPAFVQTGAAGALREAQGSAESASEKIRLLYVGRLGKDKAADLLWQALPLIMQSPRVELTVLGSGQYERDFASASFPGYHYLGYVSDRARVAEIFRQHQILLAPGPYETFGLAVLEAMASGLVVVGPDRGGTAELLAEAESPFVFRAGNLDDFVRATRAALAADLAPHAARARSVARQYGTWPEAIGRLVAYYERVAPRPASAVSGRWKRADPAGRGVGRRASSAMGPAGIGTDE
jgi:alpha-1,6-mannosyltransferase